MGRRHLWRGMPLSDGHCGATLCGCAETIIAKNESCGRIALQNGTIGVHNTNDKIVVNKNGGLFQLKSAQ